MYLNLLFDRNNDDFDVIILIGDNLALALMQIRKLMKDSFNGKS